MGAHTYALYTDVYVVYFYDTDWIFTCERFFDYMYVNAWQTTVVYSQLVSLCYLRYEMRKLMHTR